MRNSSCSLTPEQANWLKKAKQFADNIPLAEIIESDSENLFRRDLFALACEQGFGALPFPTKYGGAGGDYISSCLVNEEFAKRCVPIMSSLGVHILSQECIYKFGSDAQKEQYLPAAANGKYLGAFALTEPNAGSDTAALETTAQLIGNEYVLNGSKVFITSGGAADFYIVMAQLLENEDKGKTDNITAFIVEKNFAGFQIGQKFDMLGMRGYATSELVFANCKVPKENLLGAKGGGRKVALGSLNKGRVTIASQALGWAQGALESALNILKKQPQSPTMPVGTYSINEYLFGEMAASIEAARAMTYQAAYDIDRGKSEIILATMAKLHATDCAMQVATQALSISEVFGLKPEFLLERIFRDAKAGQIYEGTNQIQRLLIARELLR